MNELAVIDAETGEIVQPPRGLFGTDDPAEVVTRAKAHADELAKVIAQRQLYKTIRGKAYVFVEAWTLLGSMLGVFPVVDEVEPVEVNGVHGFRAAVRAVTRDGAVVGRSVAYCMRDEAMWSETPTDKYGKPMEPRNLHALAAMAETRATSRALRKPLGFIVQLAGYSPTGAEEMPSDSAGEPQATTRTVSAPGPSEAPSPADVPPPLQTEEPRATTAQKTKLNVLVGTLRDAGLVTTEQVWLEAGYPTPLIDEEAGRARWGGDHGLRERLSKRTASRLIEWLQDLETQQAAPEPQTLADMVPPDVRAATRRRLENGEE